MTKNLSEAQLKNIPFNPRLAKLKTLYERIQKDMVDMDFNLSQWAKETRSVWPSGEAGNKKFTEWCKEKLELTDHKAEALLRRSYAASLVSDAKSWHQLKGFEGIEPVLELSPLEQLAVVGHAIESVKKIRSAMKDLGFGPTPAVALSSTSKAAKLSAPQSQAKHVSAAASKDIAILANYLATKKGLPVDIRVIVDMYKTGR